MGINIKNQETEMAVRELASLTGEGLTEAIANAAREKLARLKGQRRRAASLEEYLAAIQPLQDAVARERRANKDKRTSRQLAGELYDERGLPK